MSKITPNYYAILTADVRYDKRLSPSEKLLFAEITALTHSNGHCHATNEYLASLYDLSADRVSHMISKLVKLGYLNSIINYKEGTKQVESSKNLSVSTMDELVISYLLPHADVKLSEYFWKELQHERS